MIIVDIVQDRNTPDMCDMIQWLRDNIEKEGVYFYFESHVFTKHEIFGHVQVFRAYFERNEDATFFKLRWL